MVRNTHRSESAQASVEYVLIVAAIGLACLVALIFLGGAIARMFDTTLDPSGPPGAPFEPPAVVVVPTTVEDCLHEGWRHYPQFIDEAACIDFVNGTGSSS